MEHRHLWVNVASAGGALDRWGCCEQQDYDEFTVSQDEYGFVLVEVTPGEKPEFRLERISRGHPEQPKDNEITDSLVVRRYDQPPEVPEALSAAAGTSPDSIFLQASEFFDPDGDEHGGSHWQISENCSDFSAPIASRWQQHENQYGGIDTQEGVDLCSIEISSLSPESSYCWRVRYRNRGLTWSAWSTPSEVEIASD